MKSRKGSDDRFFGADSYPLSRTRKLAREKRRQRARLRTDTERWRDSRGEQDPDLRPDWPIESRRLDVTRTEPGDDRQKCNENRP